MQLTFLGTGADSAYPLPFCHCAICREARRVGGKNVRRRSSALIDGELLIDLGPDSLQAMLNFGPDPSGVKFLLQTHPHHDHFDQNHLLTRQPEYGGTYAHTLKIVASPGTLRRMTTMLHGTGFEGDLLERTTQAQLRIEVQPIQAGETTPLGQYRVTAFSANHDSGAECLIYAIQSSEGALLYATDTDTLSEMTLDQMRGFSFSAVILDHTYGPGSDGGGHLNAERFRATLAHLQQRELLRQGAQVYATHLSHEGNTEHQNLSANAAPHGYLIPWDGLTIVL